MKCSGKQQQYPTEIDRLNKETKERQLDDLINQAKNNEENLKILSEKIDKELKSYSDSLQFLKDELKKTQKQFQEQAEIISWSQNWKVLTKDCWSDCKSKGGQCAVCDQGLAPGYCCRPDGYAGNGDCPPQHILQKLKKNEGHHCFVYNGRP